MSIDCNNRRSEVTVCLEGDEDPSVEMAGSDEDVCPDSNEEWTPLDDLLEFDLNEGSDLSDDEPVAASDGRLCTDCGKFCDLRKQHMCEHKLKPHACNICGRRFASENALNSHGKVHDEKYQNLCKYCYVAFKTKVDKISHEQSHANQEKPFRCPDCKETFAVYAERRKHLFLHIGPPTRICDICQLEFRDGRSLKRHYIVHTGRKPFRCSICQLRFSQSSHLKSHILLHTGESLFKCQQCDESFNHNSSLQTHVQKCHAAICDYEQKELNNTRECATGAHSQPENEQCNIGVVRRTTVPIFKRKSTVRPLGRPKKSAFDSSVLAGKMEDRI